MTDVSVSVASVAPAILGLDNFEQSLLNELFRQWAGKTPRNRIRAAYYDGKNAVRDLGISTPPSMRNLAVVLGWSAKAVDILNRRCRLEKFTAGSSVDLAAAGLNAIWEANRLDLEAPQVGISSLIHSCAFLITTRGDTEAGEPKTLVAAKSALHSTGLWDARRRELRAALSLIEADDAGNPTRFVMYLPNMNVILTKSLGRWKVERREHLDGMPVEPLVYQPRLGRPFGSSRISRTVMWLQDSGVRTMKRSEVQAEIFSAPQRVLLGAGEDAFQNPDGTVKTAWQAVLGRLWAIPDDEDAQNPRATVQQLQAAAQTPHLEQLRMLAQQFAGETSIPLASLGIAGEANPTSEAAYTAGREDLIQEAEGATDGWTPAWRRTALRMLSIENDWDTVPDEFKTLRAKWRSAAAPGRAAAADAGAKTLQQFPWLADTELGLELFGLDRDQITAAIDERNRINARATVEALAGGATTANGDTPDSLRTKLDALGIAIRAGVSPDSAAQLLGLPDLEFTGAVPVSLRQPESEAAGLEQK